LRVCLVSQEYPPARGKGGIGTHTLTKAKLLTQRGHEVHVLSTSVKPGPALQTAEEDGVVVHRLQPPTAGLAVTQTAPYWLGYSWLVFTHLRALEQRFVYDLIHFAEYGGEGFVYQLDRSPSAWTPVAVQLHGPLMLLHERAGWPEEDSDLYRVGRRMEADTIRLADGLLSSSATSADFAAEHYGIDRASIEVVYAGIDLDVFRPGSPPPTEQPIVVFVGNLSMAKGARTALDAVLRLRERHPGIRLRMIGDGREVFRDRLVRHAENAGAPEVVEFTGFVADRAELADHLRGAAALCAPAGVEGGPVLSNLEAMACGCPVVAGNNAGTAEGVIDGETGFLVPPDDLEATAAALDRVLGDPGLRARLSERGRRHVEDNFGLDRYIERVLHGWERTVRRSRERLAAVQRAAS
jgi:glycosyltransferase involved in cell wall biosynthesis